MSTTTIRMSGAPSLRSAVRPPCKQCAARCAESRVSVAVRLSVGSSLSFQDAPLYLAVTDHSKFPSLVWVVSRRRGSSTLEVITARLIQDERGWLRLTG